MKTIQAFIWFTVRSKKPRNPKPFQPEARVFPSWVTGNLQSAEKHLLNRIAEENRPSLKIYGYNGQTWQAIG